MDRYGQLLETLGARIPPTRARAAIAQALVECGVTGAITERRLVEVAERVQRHVSMMLSASERVNLRYELAALIAESVGEAEPVVVGLRTERDIAVARNEARNVCRLLAAGTGAQQRVVTITSELARNVVSYTEGGELSLEPSRQPPKVCIVARDRGPGIHNLPEILAGRYRSRRGMGLGLVGSKRLADAFEVDTGPDGTTIRAEVQF